VKYGGEYWKAKSDHTLSAGQMVFIVGKDGPVLRVSPSKETETRKTQ